MGITLLKTIKVNSLWGEWGIMTRAYSLSTGEAKAGELPQLKACLAYMLNIKSEL